MKCAKLLFGKLFDSSKQKKINTIIQSYVDKGYRQDWIKDCIKDLIDIEEVKKVLEKKTEEYELKEDEEIIERIKNNFKNIKEKGYIKKEYYDGEISIFSLDELKNTKIGDIFIQYFNDYERPSESWINRQLKRNRRYILTEVFSRRSFLLKENAEKVMDLCIEFLQEIKK